ncbi:hypothetical protein I3760_16G085500 [Carya illinoinensis]|nr:hypothetical protein I3760_16G085500 [Carya illinoinensis]
MAISSISKVLSFPLLLKTAKFSTVKSSAASSAEKFYTHLQINGTQNIEKTLATVNGKLDAKCVSEVLHRCHPNQFQMGLRFFIWVGIQPNYRHSPFMYRKACELFDLNRNPRVVADVIEDYRVRGCVVSAKVFKVVLNLYREARLADEALWVMKKMKDFGLRADTTVYNVVIRLFCEKGDMDKAEELMNEMGLNDLYPDMITCVAMIRGFCRVGRLEDACGLVETMRGQGCLPNAVMYSALLHGVCKWGSLERAFELLDKMEKIGGECSPNVVTYTSVIQSLCDKSQTIEALKILDRMEAFGCPPNRITVSSLIKGLCVEGRVEEAYKVIDKVVAGGSVSYGDCYSSLILSLVKLKKMEDAEKLFRKMLASGVKPDSLACSILIKELCLEGRMLDGFQLCDEIEKMKVLSSVDSDLYSILLVGLCQQSHLVEAARLAQLMLKKGIRLKASYTESIVEHLKQFEDKELVKHLSEIGK